MHQLAIFDTVTRLITMRSQPNSFEVVVVVVVVVVVASFDGCRVHGLGGGVV